MYCFTFATSPSGCIEAQLRVVLLHASNFIPRVHDLRATSVASKENAEERRGGKGERLHGEARAAKSGSLHGASAVMRAGLDPPTGRMR